MKLAAFWAGFEIQLDTASANAEDDHAAYEEAQGYRQGPRRWSVSLTAPSGVTAGCAWSVDAEYPNLGHVDASIPGGLPESILVGLTTALEDEAYRLLPVVARLTDWAAFSVLEEIAEESQCRKCGVGKARLASGKGCGVCQAKRRRMPWIARRSDKEDCNGRGHRRTGCGTLRVGHPRMERLD